jgi:hypothetical protein
MFDISILKNVKRKGSRGEGMQGGGEAWNLKFEMWNSFFLIFGIPFPTTPAIWIMKF